MQYIGKKTLTIFGTLVLLSVLVWNKVAYLTEGPNGEKDCDPITPLGDESYTQIGSTTQVNWSQRGGIVDDASCVDQTRVHGVVQVNSIKDIRDALTYAREQNMQVTPAGVKHSMGGHAFSKGNIVLDMTTFNDIQLNEQKQTITVQPGATWHDIQEVIHPRFAVMAMQSTDIFTVGGSISVNAHGMDHVSGAVENSIVSIDVMMTDGEVRTISRTQDSDLYNHVVGGYGLMGIIVEVELRVVPNDLYESKRKILDYKDFPAYFSDTIEGNTDIGLMYTHLSTAPGKTFLREAIIYEYHKQDIEVSATDIPPLGEVSGVKMRRLVMNLSKRGPWWQKLKWWSEKHLEPRMESCSISRNQAQGSGEACMVARNEPMHDSVPYLMNNLKKETDILHEYFIPRANIVAFTDDMREIMERRGTNLLNASIRVTNAERGVLTYAPEPAFSMVLYINQRTTPEGHAEMKELTSELIDITHTHNGRFFLPYQLYYTDEQLRKSYPNIDDFFAKKKEYDSENILTNTWYEKYTN